MDRAHFANPCAVKSIEIPIPVLGCASLVNALPDGCFPRSVRLSNAICRILVAIKLAVSAEYPVAQLGCSKNFLALVTNGC